MTHDTRRARRNWCLIKILRNLVDSVNHLVHKDRRCDAVNGWVGLLFSTDAVFTSYVSKVCRSQRMEGV